MSARKSSSQQLNPLIAFDTSLPDSDSPRWMLPMTDDNSGGGLTELKIVMDYVPGDSLMEMLRASVRQAVSKGGGAGVSGRAGLPEDIVRSILEQLVDVLEYLHQKGLCYVVRGKPDSLARKECGISPQAGRYKSIALKS